MNAVDPTIFSRPWQRSLDRFGASASFLCAVHCAMLPFMATTLPLLGFAFLASHTFEVVFVVLASCLALVTIGRGWLQHGQRGPVVLMATGIGLLLVGVFSEAHEVVWLHATLVVSGGLTLASAHVASLRAGRRASGYSL